MIGSSVMTVKGCVAYSQLIGQSEKPSLIGCGVERQRGAVTKVQHLSTFFCGIASPRLHVYVTSVKFHMHEGHWTEGGQANRLITIIINSDCYSLCA